MVLIEKMYLIILRRTQFIRQESLINWVLLIILMVYLFLVLELMYGVISSVISKM